MNPDLTALALRFANFAEHEVVAAVPLYRNLSRIITDDEALLSLAAEATPGQPPPNLLFGAVRFILQTHPGEPLDHFFNTPLVTGKSNPSLRLEFASFCQRYHESIRDLLRTRKVQTNEVGRSALLLPAYLSVLKRTQGLPFHLVEIGTSAGLNLIFDHYAIDYPGWKSYGPPESPVHLTTELRGDRRPPDHRVGPIVLSRIGIDLNPLDCRQSDDRAWLEALVWPGQEERQDRLRAACLLAAQTPIDLRSGDAVTILPQVLSELPAGEPVAISHSWVLNQFSDESRSELQAILIEAAKHRPLFTVGVEWAPDAESALDLTDYRRGPDCQRLGTCHPHGRWLDWTAAGS